MSDDWGPIRSTKGVATLIRFGSVLARLPDECVEKPWTRENSYGVPHRPDPAYARYASRITGRRDSEDTCAAL